MTKTYKAPGDSIPFVASGTLAGGTPIKQSALFGVVHSDVLSGETGVLVVDGVHELPCNPANVIAVGNTLYWDNANSRLTTTASGNTAVAKAASASGASVPTVEALLLPGLSTT
ncbi:MAG: DUF2190 family protein [Planctomycetota bacterium]